MMRLCVWRHPRPIGVEGRCIGRTDVPVDRRKAKRLAHRIRRAARAHGWPQVVYTSPLSRCRDVGHFLKLWGWKHVQDERLSEIDFGAWDGQPWSAIPHAEVNAWCDAFSSYRPGGGESLELVAARVQAWLPALGSDGPALIVGHAGWINTRCWLNSHQALPLHAADWPRGPAYGSLSELNE